MTSLALAKTEPVGMLTRRRHREESVMLTVVLRFIYLLSIVLWIGGMAFFSFLAAPSIFHVLPRE
jgi:hypothetical protein